MIPVANRNPKARFRWGSPEERRLSLWQRLYLPSILAGMLYTLRQLFAPKFTRQYPEERWIPPPSFRGRPVLVVENGVERCVACGLCARACPPLAIELQASETADPKERYPVRFEINMLRCIFCGYCEEVCPEEAIVMSPEWDFVFQNRQEAIYDKSRLLVPVEQLRDRLAYLHRYKDKAYPLGYDYPPENNRHSIRDRWRQWTRWLRPQSAQEGSAS